jgi:thioredoxin-like negative regulator of GroEL
MANFLRSRLKSSAAVCLISIAGCWALWLVMRPRPENLARSARQALYRGDVAQAESLIHCALRLAPTSHEVLVAAGDIAVNRGDADAAIAFYDRVSDHGATDRRSIPCLEASAGLLLKAHRFLDAEDRFRKLLALDPHHIEANRRLAATLVMSGRRRESTPYLFELVRQEEADLVELALLGNVNQIFDEPELLEQLRKSSPDEPGLHLGAARIAMYKNQLAKAAAILKPLVAKAPQQWEANVNLGKVLVESASPEEFLEWHSRLPATIDFNPDVWVIRGQFAERREEREIAIRCYWEALREDPSLWQANYQLAWLLTARGDERAALFLEQSKMLKTLSEALKFMLLDRGTPSQAVLCGELTEALGRPWEARAWFNVAANLDADLKSAVEGLSRLESRLEGVTPNMTAAVNPALDVDFSSFPIPDWKSTSLAAGRTSQRPTTRGAIKFVDLSQDTGVRFTFFSGDDPNTPGMRTWQSFGGGVAALDFDCDGWSDLYFTQGTELHAPPGTSQPSDRLFRNLGDGTFADMTEQSGLVETDYGQGVAIGDYDNDGFADIYIANIGRNRLCRGNGDGTFSDVSALSGIGADERWTASCFLADVNGDGLPDIYDVTYLAGRLPLEHLCRDPDNHEYRICPPTIFDAEQDRMYLNLGDGTFSDVTANAGLLAPEGKGLGVVAADFEACGRLDIFVSNDTTRNFYFVNETSPAGSAPRFSEQAIVRGCAYNSVGRGQASMGIAVADVDGDGLLDMYVSNFYNEYFILYWQRPGGLFVDGTSAAGLKTPSVGMLGFGTQFLDANRDGWPDLVVVNGHVDDYTHKGIPYRMRPQFYVNQGAGQFTEVSSSELGDYFEVERLGRGLARLDWDRDGLDDFAVSHLEAPASLVTCRSSPVGRFAALQLRGVHSNRDAVGAVVWATIEGRTQMQQITAGDGYYASNQKQLIFGLGESAMIEELRVRWPSGLEQRFHQVAADAEYLLVEGRGTLNKLPPPR